MEVTLFQAALIGFFYYLSWSPWCTYVGFFTLNRPLLAGFITGIILGHPMVGDRVYTDIKTGQNAGITSILVLSGESTEADLDKYGVQASFVFDGVGTLCRRLKEYDAQRRKAGA